MTLLFDTGGLKLPVRQHNGCRGPSTAGAAIGHGRVFRFAGSVLPGMVQAENLRQRR
jgi:hypothetical protein